MSEDLAGYRIFVAVAERRSFVQAAHRLGLSTSTVSQRVRSLEESLGVRLFNRTSRTVGLTEAGERFLRKVRPALDELDAAIADARSRRDVPAGVLRLCVSSVALPLIVTPVLPSFLEAYPDIVVEIAVDDAAGDLLDGRLDAGIRRQDAIPQDMVAVRVTPESRHVALASPAYLRRAGTPLTPAELSDHNCIQYRFTTGQVFKWDFDIGGERVSVPVSGSLVTDHADLILAAAEHGVGIAYSVEAHARGMIDTGRLQVVLGEYAPTFAGWFIYYPTRRQPPLPLKLFIEHLQRRYADERSRRREFADPPEIRAAS